MLAALCQMLLAPASRRPHKVHPQASDQLHRFWYLIEDHGVVVFPLLGLAVLALIVWGWRRGMSTNLVELQKREAQKESIIRMMRAKLMVNAEHVAVELHLDHFTASALLDELVREGKLIPHQVSGGVASYRLKGL